MCALMLEEGIKQHKSTDRGPVSSARRAGAGTVVGANVVGMETWRGYTLPITHDRKAQIAAVVAERSF